MLYGNANTKLKREEEEGMSLEGGLNINTAPGLSFIRSCSLMRVTAVNRTASASLRTRSLKLPTKLPTYDDPASRAGRCGLDESVAIATGSYRLVVGCDPGVVAEEDS